MIREAEREIEKENIPVLETLEKKLLELWKKASAIAGGGEPLAGPDRSGRWKVGPTRGRQAGKRKKRRHQAAQDHRS